MSSKLDPDVDQSLNPDDMAGSEAPSWAVGPDEVMTLGLSGEYLYAVKTEPPSLCTPNGTESSRDAIDCSHNDLPGDTLVEFFLAQQTKEPQESQIFLFCPSRNF